MRTTSVVILLTVLTWTAAGCATTSPRSLFRNPFRSKNDDIESLFNLARLSERHGNHADALAMYNRILEMDAKYQPALHRMAVMAARQGQFDESLKLFERALQTGAKPSAELLTDLGYVHYRRNDLQPAEVRFREALKIDPYYSQAHNNLGLVLGEQHRFDEALDEFRKAGDEAKAYANLAYTQAQCGEVIEAERNYHKALSLDNSLHHAAEALVQLETLKRQALQAQAKLAKAAEPQVHDPAVTRAEGVETPPAVRQAAALQEMMGIEVMDGRVITPPSRPPINRAAPEAPPSVPKGSQANTDSTPPVSPAVAPATSMATAQPQMSLPPARPPTPSAPLTTVPISSTDMSQASGPVLSGTPFSATGPTFSPPSFPQPFATPRQ